MAERFNQQVNLQPIDTRSGAASALLSLADRLEGFKQQALQKAGEQAIERGVKKAGQTELQKKDGITQVPSFKREGFFGSIEAQAHNKALKNAYIASLDNDNREAITRIATENPDNLINFNEQINSYRKAVIGSVDPSVRQLVQIDIDNKISSVRSKIQANEIQKQRNIAIAETERAAQSLLDESLVAARSGDMYSSAERLQDLFAIYDGQVESGIITVPEMQIKKRDAELKATRETIIGGVKQMMTDGNYNGAIEAIVKFREKVPKGFTISEHDEIIKSMTSEVNESLSLHNKMEDAEKKLVSKGQNEKSVELFTGILNGTRTVNDVISALNNGKITQEQASTLTTTLNSRGRGIDDWSLVTRIQDSIRDGEDMRKTIMANSGSNLSESTAASLMKENDQSEDDESLLKTSYVKRAEGFITQSMKVTGPFGALDQESEKRLALARRNFSERVLAGEDAWKVADELVGKDDFVRASNPMFGNKQNLEQALEMLNNAISTNQIDDDTYNFEFNKIEKLIQLRDTIQAFDKSRKDAENANR